MDNFWVNRFEELLKSQQVNYLRLGNLLLREYGSIIIPLGPVVQHKPNSEIDASIIFQRLKGKLVWWSYPTEYPVTNGWFAVVKNQYTPIEAYKSSNTRNQIKKGLKEHIVKRIGFDFLLKYGFQIFKRAQRTSISEQNYMELITRYHGFEDIIHCWGIFRNDIFIGYAIIYCYSKIEANISEIVMDPSTFKEYPNYALIHKLNEYYLNVEKFELISDGYRNILHPTKIQELLISKFGFKKIALQLEVRFRFPYNLLIRFAAPISYLGLIPASIKAAGTLYNISMEQKKLPE